MLETGERAWPRLVTDRPLRWTSVPWGPRICWGALGRKGSCHPPVQPGAEAGVHPAESSPGEAARRGGFCHVVARRTATMAWAAEERERTAVGRSDIWFHCKEGLSKAERAAKPVPVQRSLCIRNLL